jgi:hypothetical protein
MRWLAIINPLLVFCNLTKSQNTNLVSNPSFEEHIYCPNNEDMLSQNALGWNDSLLFGNGNTPDYINICGPINPDWPWLGYPPFGMPKNLFGFQLAKDGQAYAHIGVFNKASTNNYREYLITELNRSLKIREKIKVCFWVSPADSRQYAVNRLGAFLSVNPPIYSQTDGLFNYTPQIVNNGSINPLGDTSIWVLVCDTFQSPVGGEKYITLGNFFKDAESDTFSIGDGINFYSVASYYIDDVSVFELDTTTGITENEFTNLTTYPNPAQNTIALKNKAPVSVSIYSLSGAHLLSKNIRKDEEIDISTLSNGVYSVAIGNKRERLVVCR